MAGGTLAVENALKAAFDWKVRRNFRWGCKEEPGHQVLHFTHAFHGRSRHAKSQRGGRGVKATWAPAL